MDRVRFGRALGGGARDAARAILKAADAAAAPNPATSPIANPTPAPTQAPDTTTGPAASPAPSLPPVSAPTRIPTAIPTVANLRQGGKRFGQAVWSPLVRQSGILWLEFTGVFFALFAVTAGLTVWKHRHDLLVASPARPQALFALTMLLVFGYFTVSSFFKAARRGRA